MQGGVLTRPGHTEAGADLAELAGCFPAGALAEVVNDDVRGTMARTPELKRFAAQHGLRTITIDDLIRYRCHTERLVQPTAPDARLTAAAEAAGARVAAFASQIDGKRVLLVHNNASDAPAPSLRIAQSGASEREWEAAVAEAATCEGLTAVLPAPDHHTEQPGTSYVQGALVAQALQAWGIECVRTEDQALAAVLRSFGLSA